MSTDNLVKNFPLDEKVIKATLVKESDMRDLLFFTEQIELQLLSSNNKIDPRILSLALLDQLLLNLILDQLPNAKYLWKRMPKELKAEPDAQRCWKIAQSMWKKEYSNAFELIDNGVQNAGELIRPFLEKLRREYRKRCVDTVGKAYTSITVDELLKYVSSPTDSAILNSKDGGIAWIRAVIIDTHGLRDTWILNEETKIIEINTNRETYQLNSDLIREFTQYVCFMEAQQDV